MPRRNGATPSTSAGTSSAVKAKVDEPQTAAMRDSRIVLPLSSTLVNTVPDHPLLHSLFSAVLPRVAHLESWVLKSPPARLLARGLGLSPFSIVLLATAGLITGIARWREQWRAMLTFLGLAEAVSTTLQAMSRIERERDHEDNDYDDVEHDLDPVTRQEIEQGRQERVRQELKHVLSFWVLFSLLGLIESIRSSSSTIPLATRLAPFVRTTRFWVRRLALRFPSVTTYIPTRLVPSLSVGPVAARRRPFPQPRAHPARSTHLIPSLPVALFSSEPRYRIFKLLVLWQGLRRDGYGASVLWDWLVGPLFSVYHRRRTKHINGTSVSGPPPRRRVVNLVVSEEEEEAYLRGAAPRRSFDQNPFPISSTSSSSTGSSSTATSPSIYRTGGGNFPGPEGEDDGEDSFDSSIESSRGSSAFPTPNVPFRLTSSSHPIQARSHSFPSSGISYGTSSTALIGGDGLSPSPASRSIVGGGGYDVESESLGLGLGSGGTAGGRLNWGSSTTSSMLPLGVEGEGQKGWGLEA